jgi:hypothetical protein
MISFGNSCCCVTHDAYCITLVCTTSLSPKFADLLARISLPPWALSDTNLQDDEEIQDLGFIEIS